VRLIFAVSFAFSSLFIANAAGASPNPWYWPLALKVHHCEEPVWNVRGPVYSGGLGWRNSLWSQFRAPWMPSSMADAKPLWQAWAMSRFVETINHGYWPDQHGCEGSY
jgi:hypothetical protein